MPEFLPGRVYRYDIEYSPRYIYAPSDRHPGFPWISLRLLLRFPLAHEDTLVMDESIDAVTVAPQWDDVPTYHSSLWSNDNERYLR